MLSGASINEVEALAFSQGLIVVRAKGINRLIIEEDSMLIIREIKRESQSSWM